MKKITLLLFFVFALKSLNAQVLNQPANWPNSNWSITGSYLTDTNVFEANPTTSSNFAYDDDDAGNGHSDLIAAESPVIDLTAAHTAGETWISFNSLYVYNRVSEILIVQYWDTSTGSWLNWGAELSGTTGAPNNNYCSGNKVSAVVAPLNIAPFNASQLSGFRYRILYDDDGNWGWGFCLDSPTVTSQTPPACPNITGLSVSNVNVNTADVSWQAGSDESLWEVVVQSPGGGIPTGSGEETFDNNPHQLTGLAQNTPYEVYVRGNCGGGDFSNWIGPVNFTTLAPSRVNFIRQNISVAGSYDLTVVDMNGDFLDDIVSASSNNVNVYYQQDGGGFTHVSLPTPSANYLPTWSMAAADFDRNGYTDLLYGSGSGVTFMKANATGTGFTQVSSSEYVFSQRSNFADINNDGHLDAFVCHDVQPNVYYINDGNGNFTFNQGGLGDYPSGGNYGSIWIDYDNDRDLDMFIAKCGGETARRTNVMLTNNGNGTFTENAAALGLADPMQTWSSTWGDYDNDGDMDVFIGGSSDPHKLMRNNGDNTFTNVTSTSGISVVTTLGHESVSYDFDNDGNLDVACNGVILYGNGDLTFTEVDSDELNYKNGSFGDLNNDGFVDAYYNGVIYMNGTTPNNWVKINTVGVQSNVNGIGARVELYTSAGVQIRDVRSGEGFEFMSSLNTHFGIGTQTAINNIIIYWPSGIVDNVIDPDINTTHTIVEGATLNVSDPSLEGVIIHPNPVKNILQISTPASLSGKIATIFDVNGKRVLNLKLENDSIDVSSLQSGIYFLRLESNGTSVQKKFIKN
ncbi:FG-GAP-like repeat-containing protein [Subsaxibacter sp. CAU 1640]|uniref:FG-GAP-like repeat-containing protein n=1 Tax=Subsaxibacter sp. CAU 1640 TaxID=2933271 RepID=UPI00200581D2|nr:FG-GAP-like repeat-containing protein [Subsaxibacter sp. CAU 1640]MCK7589431.1 FG-GAP-like repeat-containing protein [Subsaxibacter sp. CAU 1640]